MARTIQNIYDVLPGVQTESALFLSETCDSAFISFTWCKRERTACLGFNATPISVLLLHRSIFPLVLRACTYTLALTCDIVLDVNLP